MQSVMLIDASKNIKRNCEGCYIL